MTPEGFKEAMQMIYDYSLGTDDLSDTHERADILMCQILQELGYGAGINIFCKLKKWYG